MSSYDRWLPSDYLENNPALCQFWKNIESILMAEMHNITGDKATDFFRPKTKVIFEMRPELSQFLNKLAQFSSHAVDTEQTVKKEDLDIYQRQFNALVEKYKPEYEHNWPSKPLLSLKTLGVIGAGIGFFATGGVGGVIVGGILGAGSKPIVNPTLESITSCCRHSNTRN